ncbi:MAG: hypothetical protein ACLUEF_02375 [Faecalibacterium prausnitzii]
MPKDIRLISSHYDDLYRIPDGGVIQIDYPDGRSFTAKLEHLDNDYRFDMGGLGSVFHICQFADIMGRNHADFCRKSRRKMGRVHREWVVKAILLSSPPTMKVGITLSITATFPVMDGGQVDAPELTGQEVREQNSGNTSPCGKRSAVVAGL